MLMNEEGRVEREEWSGSNKGTNLYKRARAKRRWDEPRRPHLKVGQGGETDQTDQTGDADRGGKTIKRRRID